MPELEDDDELILAEADVLSGLDVTGDKSTFDNESNKRYMESVARRRLPRFITDFSKREVGRLLEARIAYYEEDGDLARFRI